MQSKNNFMASDKNKFQIKDYKKKININLGCGQRPLADFINVDYFTTKNVDVITDLNKNLPFGDNYADLIYSDNVFEHIQNILNLIKECQRVLKPGGKLITRVPYFRSKGAFVDPTHVNFYTLQSMDYFVKGTYFHEQYRFFEETFSKRAIIIESKRSPIHSIINKIAVRAPHRFENSIVGKLYNIHTLVFILTK